MPAYRATAGSGRPPDTVLGPLDDDPPEAYDRGGQRHGPVVTDHAKDPILGGRMVRLHLLFGVLEVDR